MVLPDLNNRILSEVTHSEFLTGLADAADGNVAIGQDPQDIENMALVGPALLDLFDGQKCRREIENYLVVIPPGKPLFNHPVKMYQFIQFQILFLFERIFSSPAGKHRIYL